MRAKVQFVAVALLAGACSGGGQSKEPPQAWVFEVTTPHATVGREALDGARWRQSAIKCGGETDAVGEYPRFTVLVTGSRRSADDVQGCVARDRTLRVGLVQKLSEISLGQH